MGFGSFIKKATGYDVVKKTVNTVTNAVSKATGKLFGMNESSGDNSAQLQAQLVEQQKQAKVQQELANQNLNRNNQNDANSGALQTDALGGGDDTTGVLTGVGGLSEDKRLNKKKALGG